MVGLTHGLLFQAGGCSELFVMAENMAMAKCCMAALCAEPRSLVGATATRWWWDGTRLEKGSRPSHGKGFSDVKFLILRDCGQAKRGPPAYWMNSCWLAAVTSWLITWRTSLGTS